MHEINRIAPQSHMVNLIKTYWVEAGFEVIEVFGTDTFRPADLAMLHVDLSVVPPEYLDFAARYPRTINAKVADIRKRNYSVNQVTPGDDYEGAVIVKTSLNHAGWPEAQRRRVANAGNPFYRLYWRLFGGRAERAPFRIHSKAQYRIYSSKKEVPADVFDCASLIVEKFLPEREGDKYYLREWYFLCDSEFVTCEMSDNPIFTSGESVPNRVQAPPQEIRNIRERLGIEYGKIDYGIHDGSPVLFDVNKTTGGGSATNPFAQDIAKTLSNGIYTCFPELRPASGANS